jgi:hypothetical protein
MYGFEPSLDTVLRIVLWTDTFKTPPQRIEAVPKLQFWNSSLRFIVALYAFFEILSNVKREQIVFANDFLSFVKKPVRGKTRYFSENAVDPP